jgi:N-acetylneuraminic acid mutarotase
LFGGATADSSETPLDDLWSYDYASQTWEQIKFTSGPSARGWATLTYSPRADRLVLIGGGTDRYSFTNEVWIFDPNAKTWMQVGPQ